MHLHLLGICGTFMGGIAAIAREAGHRVTGCDANVYPPMSDQLRALGIELIEGFSADQLALQPDVFVIGNVVSRARRADGEFRKSVVILIVKQRDTRAEFVATRLACDEEKRRAGHSVVDDDAT